MVKSQIIKANGEPVTVDYMMRPNGDSACAGSIRRNR
jgi:hypothetical protein